MCAAVNNAIDSTVSDNACSPDAPGNLAGVSKNIQLPCLPDGIMDCASTPLVSAVRGSDLGSASDHTLILSHGAPAHEALDNKRDAKQDQGP